MNRRTFFATLGALPAALIPPCFKPVTPGSWQQAKSLCGPQDDILGEMLELSIPYSTAHYIPRSWNSNTSAVTWISQAPNQSIS